MLHTPSAMNVSNLLFSKYLTYTFLIWQFQNIQYSMHKTGMVKSLLDLKKAYMSLCVLNEKLQIKLVFAIWIFSIW